MTVVIHDAAGTLIDIFQRGPAPVAISGLAGGVNPVAIGVNVAAGADIVAAGRAIAVLSWILSGAYAGPAAQASIVIDDLPPALVGIFKCRVAPAAIAFLAARVNPVAVIANVLAGGGVIRPAILAGILPVSVRPAIIGVLPGRVGIMAIVVVAINVATAVAPPVAAALAAQRTVVVDDLAGAALNIGQLSGTPVAAGVLTAGEEVAAVHADLSAGLLIGTRRDPLGRRIGAAQENSESDQAGHGEVTHSASFREDIIRPGGE